MFAALLDTSVLWPSLQRDFLLSLAIEGLYRPLWSSAILDELQFHEARKLVERGCAPDEAARQSQRLIDQMSTAFDDSSVENWEHLNGTFGLPDPDDEHVVAAALVVGAQVIVTSTVLRSADVPPGSANTLRRNAFGCISGGRRSATMTSTVSVSSGPRTNRCIGPSPTGLHST